MKEGAQYQLNLYTNDPVEEMELFYMDEDNDWIEADLDSTSQRSVIITDLNRHFPPRAGAEDLKVYVAFPYRLGWINCDKFIRTDNLSKDITLSLGADYNGINTDAFIVFNDLNSILKLSYDEESRTFITPPIPTGESVEVITVTDLGDNDFQLGREEVIVKSDLSIQLEPKSKALKDIEKLILDL